MGGTHPAGACSLVAPGKAGAAPARPLGLAHEPAQAEPGRGVPGVCVCSGQLFGTRRAGPAAGGSGTRSVSG